MRRILLLATLVSTLAWPQTAPEVSITSGRIRGALSGQGGAVFKGIPFAQPPTGSLRWREPVPTKPWRGLRDGSAFGPPCVQGGAQGTKSSEDCLYLNVWTPDGHPNCAGW